MPTTKTYTPLSEIPKALITKCSQILPNKCQCWKAGEFQVEEIVPKEPTENDPSTSKTISYQLCKAHAVIQEQADKLAAKAEAEAQTNPEEAAKAQEHAENLKAAAPQGTAPTPPEPKSDAVQTPTGGITSPAPGSFHEQMLQAVQGAQTTQMPKGEDSPNNK